MNQNDLYRCLGYNIRTIRLEKRMNQDDLAKQLQLSRASISNIELGRHRIQIHVLYQIAVVLDTSIQLLLALPIECKDASS